MCKDEIIDCSFVSFFINNYHLLRLSIRRESSVVSSHILVLQVLATNTWSDALLFQSRCCKHVAYRNRRQWCIWDLGECSNRVDPNELIWTNNYLYLQPRCVHTYVFTYMCPYICIYKDVFISMSSHMYATKGYGWILNYIKLLKTKNVVKYIWSMLQKQLYYKNDIVICIA